MGVYKERRATKRRFVALYFLSTVYLFVDPSGFGEL